MTLIRLTLRKPVISTGSNGPLGSEKDLALGFGDVYATEYKGSGDTKFQTVVITKMLQIITRLRRKEAFLWGLRCYIFVFEGLKLRNILTKLVRRTYISPEFLLNLVYHAIDLEQSVLCRRKRCAIDLSSSINEKE